MARSVKEIQKEIKRISEVKENAIRNKIISETALGQVKVEAKKLKDQCKKLGVEPKSIKKEIQKVTEKLNEELDDASEVVEQLENLEAEQEEEEL